MQRWVRDLLAIAGQITFELGRIVKVHLNQRNSLARRFHKPLEKYFATLNIQVALGGG